MLVRAAGAAGAAAASRGVGTTEGCTRGVIWAEGAGSSVGMGCSAEAGASWGSEARRCVKERQERPLSKKEGLRLSAKYDPIQGWERKHTV